MAPAGVAETPCFSAAPGRVQSPGKENNDPGSELPHGGHSSQLEGQFLGQNDLASQFVRLLAPHISQPSNLGPPDAKSKDNGGGLTIQLISQRFGNLSVAGGSRMIAGVISAASNDGVNVAPKCIPALGPFYKSTVN